MPKPTPPVCLTIGASDSSGATGIQADLKTFLAYQCHGTSVVAAVGAQSPHSIHGMHLLPDDFVRDQLNAAAECMPISTVKIGFLPSAGTIRAVAAWLRERPGLPLVIDPVATDSRGIPLLHADAVHALGELLLPRATICTPNRFEAAMLAGMDECLDVEDMQNAAQAIFRKFGCPTVVTGGGLSGRTLDVFAGMDGISHFEAATASRAKVHGAGSTHSAAITACIARGESLREAITHAKLYVSAAIAAAPTFGNGYGVLWHQISVQELGAEPTPLHGTPILPPKGATLRP
jgi:hydroxymethylpyrimidine/phosphomethylpyrimidine kinase